MGGKLPTIFPIHTPCASLEIRNERQESFLFKPFFFSGATQLPYITVSPVLDFSCNIEAEEWARVQIRTAKQVLAHIA